MNLADTRCKNAAGVFPGSVFYAQKNAGCGPLVHSRHQNGKTLPKALLLPADFAAFGKLFFDKLANLRSLVPGETEKFVQSHARCLGELFCVELSVHIAFVGITGRRHLFVNRGKEIDSSRKSCEIHYQYEQQFTSPSEHTGTLPEKLHGSLKH